MKTHLQRLFEVDLRRLGLHNVGTEPESSVERNATDTDRKTNETSTRLSLSIPRTSVRDLSSCSSSALSTRLAGSGSASLVCASILRMISGAPYRMISNAWPRIPSDPIDTIPSSIPQGTSDGDRESNRYVLIWISMLGSVPPHSPSGPPPLGTSRSDEELSIETIDITVVRERGTRGPPVGCFSDPTPFGSQGRDHSMHARRSAGPGKESTHHPT